jgi:hypothetical protein
MSPLPAAAAQVCGVINLLDDDAARDVTLTLIMDGSPVTLKVLSGISLEQLVARSLEALEMWTVSQADLEMQLGVDTWAPVARVEDLRLTDPIAVPPHIRVVVRELHEMDDVKVPFIGALGKASSRLQSGVFMQERLRKVFHFARTVKGDGNCFYRGVAFRLIEYTATRPFGDEELPLEVVETQLHELASLLADVEGLEDSERTLIHKLFNETVFPDLLAFPDYSKIEVSTAIKDEINHNPELDLALTNACRRVIANYIQLQSTQPQKEGSTDISLVDVVSCNFDGLSVEEFIDTIVLLNGRDAEDIIVALAGKAFDANITVWQPDPVMGISCLAADDGAQRANGVLHLLLHSGHYNLLYPRPRGATESGDITKVLAAGDDSSASPECAPEKRARRNEYVCDISPASDSLQHLHPATAQYAASLQPAARNEVQDPPHIQEIRQGRMFASTSVYFPNRREAVVVEPVVAEPLSASGTTSRKRTLVELDKELPSYSDED